MLISHCIGSVFAYDVFCELNHSSQDAAASKVRNWVTPDGAAGPTGGGGFKAEAGRYHLYVATNCPWAHRTMILRTLKCLEGVVTQTIVLPRRTEAGWVFGNDAGLHRDPVVGAHALHQIYTASDPTFTGRVTVPVLWDKERGEIVNNESSEIIRMLNSAFAAHTDEATDFYPAELRGEIDAVNADVFEHVNVGVYKAGFATKQAPYETAVTALFATLDALDARLARQRYLCGDRLTEADWRLFTTLLRFDPVYHGHFKCNLRRLVDYANLWGFTRELYQVPGVAETVDIEHIKRHYYGSQLDVNPTGVVPSGPDIDFAAPHDRERFPRAA
ncbi:MAG: glutathione S-transferase family protein [Planctomycetes bacterium]|nr:glutathione S-transferase family protein [Planctomycetota bacterium]